MSNGEDVTDIRYVDEHIMVECDRSGGQTIQGLTGSTMGGVHGCGQDLLCNGCCFVFCLWMMDVDESL